MNIPMIIVGSVVPILGIYIYVTLRKMKNGPMAKDNERIKILTEQNFQNQIKTGLTLVDFWADWCMPCKMMAPVLNNVADELTENASVGKVNIEQYQSVATKYMVRSIPTLILFKNGKEVNRYVGVNSKEFLLKQINNYK